MFEKYKKIKYPDFQAMTLDGGKGILLANFQGPCSLKCISINGGLAKPAPAHTYAVVDREFLCDCQCLCTSLLKQTAKAVNTVKDLIMLG